MNLRQQSNPFPGIGQGLEQFPGILDPHGLILPQPDRHGLFQLGTPVRKIRGNHRSVTGSVPFPSLRRIVRFESAGERDLLLALKKAPLPVGVLEQPLTISPKALGFHGSKYTPDFLLWLFDPLRGITQVVLVEVKPEEVLQEGLLKYRDRLKAGRRFATRNGWSWRLITGRRTRSQEIQEVVWPAFHVPEAPLVESSLLLSRLFSSLGGAKWMQ